MAKEIYFFPNVLSTVDLQSGHGFQLFSSNYCTVMVWTSIAWCLLSLLFKSAYFLNGCPLSIYNCTTVNGSLFWGHVHWKSAFMTSFGKVFCRPAVTSLKKHFLGLFCTWLLLDLFDGPSCCTGRESQQVHVCPFLLQTTCSIWWSHYLNLVPHILHISLLI